MPPDIVLKFQVYVVFHFLFWIFYLIASGKKTSFVWFQPFEICWGLLHGPLYGQLWHAFEEYLLCFWAVFSVFALLGLLIVLFKFSISLLILFTWSVSNRERYVKISYYDYGFSYSYNSVHFRFIYFEAELLGAYRFRIIVLL